MRDLPAVAVFGGTKEGREIAQHLAGRGVPVTAYVATEYGESLLPGGDNLTVASGRLDAWEMGLRLSALAPAVVVDATHPYATAVTENLKQACETAGLPYLRVVRESLASTGVVDARDMDHAVELLSQSTGKVLLTTGSKDLAAFQAVRGWRERLYARVLPDPDVVAKCTALGLRGQHLICMQGPFTKEINSATIRMLNIETVVTKDTGGPGGFSEKAAAARECGVQMIVIGRTSEGEEGLPLPDAIDHLERCLGLPAETPGDGNLPRFPLFVSLAGREALVVGGGTVAARRIATLRKFGVKLTVLSPELCPELQAAMGSFRWIGEPYRGIVGKPCLVVAATSDRVVNRQIGRDATAACLPVSVADRREESTFWFPAVAVENGLVAGITSTDGNHPKVREAAAAIRAAMKDL